MKYDRTANTPNTLNVQQTGSWKRLAAVLIVIIIVAAIGLVLYFQFYPPVATDMRPDTGEYAAVENSLEEGRRMDLASPDRRSWDNGDLSVYTLVIINRYTSTDTFHLRIFLEKLGGELEGIPVSSLSEKTKDWFTYKEELTLEPGAKEAVTISMKIPDDSLKGSYKFRVLACDNEPCELKTGNIYDSTSISLYVRG
jgi:hypothetical protein